MARPAAAKAPRTPSSRTVEDIYRDVTIEELIERSGATFQLVDVPIGDIDVRASAHNQARISDALDKAYVQEMLTARRRGATFPAGVGVPGEAMPDLHVSPKKIVLLDGNHRCAMLIANKDTHFPLYLLAGDTPVATLVELRDTFNQSNGKRPVIEDQLYKAIMGVLNKELTEKEALFRFPQVTPASLRKGLEQQRALQRAQQVGVSSHYHFARLPDRWISALNGLGLASPFKEAANQILANKSLITPNTGARTAFAQGLESLVKETSAIDSEAGQAAYVRSGIQRIFAEAYPAATRNPSSGVARLLRRLTPIMAEGAAGVLASLQSASPADKVSVSDQCEQVAEILLDVAANLTVTTNKRKAS